jgi:hypothetical protein
LRYFDTSVVFSLYINETRTASVDIELRKNPADVIISPWVDIEQPCKGGKPFVRRLTS